MTTHIRSTIYHPLAFYTHYIKYITIKKWCAIYHPVCHLSHHYFILYFTVTQLELINFSLTFNILQKLGSFPERYLSQRTNDFL